jgi:gamma-glutamyl-gamma-aminobutyrate hydrolase PuuD
VIRVGLTQRTVTERTGEVRDALDQRWAALLESWTMLAFPVPTAISSPESYLEALRPGVVLLTGGDDLASLADAQHSTPARDAFERRIADYCVAHQIAVIGVCRGMQLLAQLSGAQLVRVDGHVARRHKVTVRGAPVTEDGEREVNSYHSYGIAGRELPETLRPFAWDEQGNVEAFARHDALQFGMMWHPEREPSRDEWAVRVLELLVRRFARPS